MSPDEALLPENAVKLSEQIYNKVVKNTSTRVKSTLKIGDFVRLSMLFDSFAKAYENQWSRALFMIWKGPYFTIGGRLPMYKVKGAWNDIKVSGGFYEKELKFVDPDIYVNKYEFPIEQVQD